MISVPQLGPAIPRAHSALASAFGRLMLGLSGWRVEGGFPDVPKMMIIVAPHTSNWDFPVGLMAKFSLRLGCGYIAKQSLFWWPLGVFLRAMGGIAIDRSAASDIVAQTAREYASRRQLALVITPEGTRSRVDRWKSGFHRIAKAAGVPIVLAVFDYREKVVRLGPWISPTDDYDADLRELQSHIRADMAKRPECYGQ